MKPILEFEDVTHIVRKLQPLCEDAAPFDARKVDMAKLYREYNQKYFQNRLPTDLKFEWTNRMKRAIGQTYYKVKRDSSGGRTLLPGTFQIKMNGNINFSEEDFKSTFIHEMIHVWVAAIDNDLQEMHGFHFRKKMNEIQSHFPHKISITHDGVLDRSISAHAKKDIGIIIYKRDDGEYSYSLMSKTYALNNIELLTKFLEMMLKRTNYEEAEVLIGNTPLADMLPIQRDLPRKIYRFRPNEREEILKNKKRVLITANRKEKNATLELN